VVLLRFGFVSEGCRRVCVRGGLVADVAAFASEAFQKLEKNVVGFGLAGDLIKVRQASFWQKQAVAIAQHHRFAERPVLVLFEFKLTQVAVGLFAAFRFDAL
jgi:hypothetical protein